VIVREERAVLLEEVQQVRHLLQVGRDARVGVVAVEMRVVELEIDHVLHAVRELARRGLRIGRGGRRPGRAGHLHGDEHGDSDGREHRRCCELLHQLPLSVAGRPSAAIGGTSLAAAGAWASQW